MDERQAAFCSFHEYELRFKGYEDDFQKRWELTRWQTWQLLMPNFKKGNEPKTPQAFCRFPWEKDTDAEINKAFERSRITPQEQEWLDRLFPRNDINS